MSLTEMDLQPVSEEDMASVMTLEASMPDSPLWASATDEEQRAIVRQGNMFGIYKDGVLIGKVGFWNNPEEGWEVDGMIVLREFRNKQYGSELFDYALRQIREKEHPASLVLYTHPSNSPAIRMYLRAGFDITDFIRNKYGPGKDRLQMKKILPS